MKRTFRSTVALITAAAIFELMATGSLAAAPTAPSRASRAPIVAPKVVMKAAPLSADELARYQAKSESARPVATEKAAGASGNNTVWIVVGVVVVVGVIALASGGGGGGGGY